MRSRLSAALALSAAAAMAGAQANSPTAISAPDALGIIKTMLTQPAWKDAGYSISKLSFSTVFSEQKANHLTVTISEHSKEAPFVTVDFITSCVPALNFRETLNASQTGKFQTAFEELFKGKKLAGPYPGTASLKKFSPFTGIDHFQSYLCNLMRDRNIKTSLSHLAYSQKSLKGINLDLPAGEDAPATSVQMVFDCKSGKMTTIGFCLDSEYQIPDFDHYYKFQQNMSAWSMQRQPRFVPAKHQPAALAPRA